MGFGFIIEHTALTPDFSAKKADIPMRDIAKKAADESAKNIRKQKEFDETPFRPLSASRLKAKRKAGYSQPEKALIATGKMLRNIAPRKIKNGNYIVTVSNKAQYKTVKGNQLSEIHNYLGAGKGRVIRNFIGWTKALDEYALKRINRFVKTQMKKTKKTTVKGKS